MLRFRFDGNPLLGWAVPLVSATVPLLFLGFRAISGFSGMITGFESAGKDLRSSVLRPDAK